MPNNPVQIVLNDASYLRAPDPKQFGAEKDFFEGRNQEFSKHRDLLLAEIENIEAIIKNWTYGPLCYLRIKMRQEAIAKSYRPYRAIFLPDQFPCIGAGAPGELYFRAPLIYFQRLKRHILQAENQPETRISRNTGKPYLNPTRSRSEVGAIESIELAPSGQKQPFSTDSAVAAMSDERVASGYIVELFESRPLLTPGNDDVLGFHRSVATLQSIFRDGGPGLQATILPSPGGTPAIEVVLTLSTAQASIEDRRVVQEAPREIVPSSGMDLSLSRHDSLLQRLIAHPLVRRIRAPLLIQATERLASTTVGAFPEIGRVSDGKYPRVGLIDTGVTGPLTAWVLNRHDFLDEADCDASHGTMVAGALVGARSANTPALGKEEDGCDIVDLPMLPKAPFSTVYGRRGFEAFLEELEAAITEARDTHRIRVFNMSLNLIAPVEQDTYGIYAARLDDIQDRLGVVIVNSAGNLGGSEWRSPWPKTPSQVLAALAARTTADTIFMPCESVRAIAVGALNPPNSTHVEGAPTTYTRIGPGLRVGVKPDVAEFGGTGDANNPTVTHFVTCDASGNAVQTRGTSFAAPLVAKTLAALDVSTGERLTPRTLRAFLIHHAAVPSALASARLRDVARRFTGFGQPSSSASMLETEDHAITMVFESRLTAGEKKPAILRFGFQWPRQLLNTSTGRCRGRVRMTLVYDAPIDQAFGTEFVRVNLDAHLRQRQTNDRKDGKPSFRDEISQAFLPRAAKLTVPERTLIDQGLKCWPTKRYEAHFGNGVGESAEWRLEVESTVRAEASFPAEGVPFSLIFTIEDEERNANIFQTFRQELLANRVSMQDIQTAIQVRPQTRS
jgi:Subtilase family